MPDVKLHLTRLDWLAKNPVTEAARTVSMAMVPSVGQYLVVDSEACVVEATYLDVGRNPGVHVFATWTSAATDHARRVGLKQSSAGYPSSPTNFEGQTIGDLIAFLNQWPRNMAVQFSDDDLLVADENGGDLILRLDDKDEA